MTSRPHRRALSAAVFVTLLVSGLAQPAGAISRDPDGDRLPSSFEKERTGTNPRKADTDGDGIPDGREDPDDDGLDNRWEYRLGTAPRKADTDGDGTRDGREDHDGDRLRDAWEVRVSRTDPRKVDTDLDGLVDAVEDPDGDELSNGGEQHFGTDPAAPDTDADGTDDWHEDSDGDGTEDGLTQDKRRVPSGLRPSLAKPGDRTSKDLACYATYADAALRLCTFGPVRGKRVVVVGDSHALSWRRAFERIAQARHWRVSLMSKSACPLSDFVSRPSCATWRQTAIRRITRIRPALVIVAEYDGYWEEFGTGDPVGDAARWRQGLVKSLRRLDRVARRVVVLGDNSRFVGDPAGCLREHRSGISRCSLRRSDAVGFERVEVDRASASAAGVSYRPTDGLTCPYDPCPLVTGTTLMAYDQDHLTLRYAESLWRGLAKLLPR